MAHLGAVPAARALHRPHAVREDDGLAGLERDGLTARLRAGTLLEEEKVAAREAVVEQHRRLQWEVDVAVAVLVEAVEAALLVAEQQRGRPPLPSLPAVREEGVERPGIPPF